MLKVTRKSFACGFVSCLNGSTISDLDKARYRHGGGEFVYFDIINLFEVIEVMLDEKFNRINIYYGGEHEQVHHDTLAHQYISPEINVRDRLVGRSTVICSKTDGPVKIELVNQNKSLMSIARSMKKKIFREADHLKVIEDRIKLMHNRSYGILYKSEYQPY
ncbi:MAG: hypothetical protein CMO74_12955 [Verrucomicrobiales bacterium]|nr:hypothetical protein [Verrucomicrobiales bacterium]